MRTCVDCHAEKQDSEFGVHSGYASGLDPRCRQCARIRNRLRYEANREKERARARAKNANRDKTKLRYDPFKRRTYRYVQAALRSGLIVRPESCSSCGWTGKPEAHHEDYSKPLEIIWLCDLCHGLRHREP